MTDDPILTGRASGVAMLPPEQREMLKALSVRMQETPPPAGLGTAERIGWTLALLPVERAGDFAGALGAAQLVSGLMAGKSPAEAEADAFATVQAAAEAAARLVAEQRAAIAETRH